MRRDLDVGPRGNSPACAGSMIPVNQQSMRTGFPQHVGQYRPGVSPFFVPGWLELCLEL